MDEPQTHPWALMSLADFTGLLARGAAVPGGGSAAALTGALAAALVGMVGRLTAGRETYADREVEMETLIAEADGLRARLLALIDTDSQAYRAVIAAYRMPRETFSQKAQRTGAIQTALRNATDVPLEAAELCLQTLELAVTALAHGNRNAAGDAAVAALLAHAALQSQVRNALVNLAAITDAHYCDRVTKRATEIAAAGEIALSRALAAADAEDEA